MKIKIFKQKAGVIAPVPVWVCFEGIHMYIHESLIGLIWLVISEWRHDRHLAM